MEMRRRDGIIPIATRQGLKALLGRNRGEADEEEAPYRRAGEGDKCSNTG